MRKEWSQFSVNRVKKTTKTKSVKCYWYVYGKDEGIIEDMNTHVISSHTTDKCDVDGWDWGQKKEEKKHKMKKQMCWWIQTDYNHDSTGYQHANTHTVYISYAMCTLSEIYQKQKYTHLYILVIKNIHQLPLSFQDLHMFSWKCSRKDSIMNSEEKKILSFTHDTHIKEIVTSFPLSTLKLIQVKQLHFRMLNTLVIAVVPWIANEQSVKHFHHQENFW